MARTVTEITVFLASPGDVARERAAVRRAADEVNHTTGGHAGFHLVVKGWETHTRPAATRKGRAQDAIFQQIGPFDIFLGIMGARVGSPTGKAVSGTVEEYEAARQQWSRRRVNRPSVMFYFRQRVSADIDALDGDQIKAVQTFKKRVFADGLATVYPSVPRFERLLRDHLTREARAILQRVAGKTKKKPTPKPIRPTPSPAPTGTPPKAKPKKGGTRKTPTRAPATPRLSVPTVPKPLTDAARKAFARKALSTCRTEFKNAARTFNAAHDNARILVAPDGHDAFTVTADANGHRYVTARVRLEEPRWGGATWTLVYETAQSGFSFGSGELYYQQQAQVQTADDGFTATYQTSYVTFETGERATSDPLDVARLFWNRLTIALAHR